MKLKHKKLVKRIIVSVSLIIAIIILTLLKSNEFISEYIFSRGLARGYIFLLANITSIIEISLFEIALYIVIITILILLYKWVQLLVKRRKTEFYKSFLNTSIVVLSILLVYVVTASFAYYRKPLPLPQYQGETVESTQMEEMISYYLKDFQDLNSLIKRDNIGMVELPYSDKELANLFIKEYDRIGTFNGYFSRTTPRYKNMLSSDIMNYMHTSGIAIVPTGEAHINKHTPTNWKLVTIAHELAHIKGVMNENDANLVAYYLTLTSENIYLRYAGYMYTISKLFEIAYFELEEQTYTKLYEMLPQEAMYERNIEYNFWQQYQTAFEKISNFFNDVYLKLSGIQDGVDNYIDNSQHGIIIDEQTGETRYGIIEYSPIQKLYIAMYLKQER